MKIAFTLTCSISLIILTLIFRSVVYDIRDYTPPIPLKNLSTPAQGNTITLHYHEKRPYYITYNNGVHGLVADPIRQAFEHADLPFQWIKTPARRQLDIIEENDAKTCAAGWFKTPAREQFAKFSKAIYRDRPFIGITRADNPLLLKTQTIKKAFHQPRLRLLIKNGYSYGKYIDQLISQMSPRQVSTTADTQGMLEMILMQRADYVLLTEEEASDPLLFSRLNKNKFKLIRFTDTPAGNYRYIICSQKITDDELGMLNNAIDHLALVTEEEDYQP